MTQAAKTETLPRIKMTFEEFLAWADEDTNAEWVDGEVIPMSPAEDIHQFLFKWLIKTLDEWVVANDLGTLIPAPFQMRLTSRPSGREPDILFVSRENSPRLKKTFVNGPADMVIEIISPESRTRDRDVKYAEYEKAGVREYWLLDPVRQQASFYQLDSGGIYHSISSDSDGIYHSAVLTGLWLKVDWLWQTPLPRLAEVLKAWGLY